MNMVPVASSNISAIGYDKTTHTLRIRFHSGGTYQYNNISESLYSGLMNAGSKGGYFSDFIKNSYHGTPV